MRSVFNILESHPTIIVRGRKEGAPERLLPCCFIICVGKKGKKKEKIILSAVSAARSEFAMDSWALLP